MHSEYLTSAAKAEQLPPYNLPEIAFVGRSNCGKSSLLNALLNRKDLARTSRTPGRTQMVNFFQLNKSHIFADLPGYGFSATGSHTREHWFELLNTYFERQNISWILFLMDSRRQFDDEDDELLEFLASKQNVVLVLTKTDKLNKFDLNKQIQNALSHTSELNCEIKAHFEVSSMKKLGIDELRKFCLST